MVYSSPSRLLDRSSPIPLYHQLQTHIQQQISLGHLSPGDQLPSLETLADQFGVSMAVVRQAVRVLVQEEVLETQQGRGIFVLKPRTRLDLHLMSPHFYEEAASLGLDLSLRVLERRLLPSERKEGVRLAVPSGEHIIHIAKVRCVNAIPIALADSYYPQSDHAQLIQPGLDSEEINRLLEETIYPRLATSDISASAQAATEEEAEILEMCAGTPLLVLDQISRDAIGTPIQLAIVKVNPLRVRMGVRLENMEFTL